MRLKLTMLLGKRLNPMEAAHEQYDHQGQANLETLQTYWSAMARYDIDAALETLDTARAIHIPARFPMATSTT